MKKIQFFILIESILFTLAFFDTLASETARTLLLIAVILILFWYITGRKGLNALLTTALSLIFLVFFLNIYFIIGVLLMVVYILVNFFSRYEKQYQYSQIVLGDQHIQSQHQKSQWFGHKDHSQDQYGFEDINIICLFGNDVVDLDQTVLIGRDNVVVIRKTFGKTKIIIPIDVELSLSASSLYGRVYFLGDAHWDLRNESFSIATPDYSSANKRVKVVINSLYGDVEVVRV
ncbi:TPA: hypothetical protein TZ704_001651 [Streptococcus suis]|nr:hypothetical protein [Streptococcus suis]